MNKWAVRALMARFYLYANQPDLARQYAEDVIEHSGRSLVTNMASDHAMFDESLFGLYYANMQNDYQSYFTTPVRDDSQTQRLITEYNLQYTFETASVGSNDIRGRSGQGFVRDNGVAMSRKYLCIENDSYDLRIPLIRLSEMPSRLPITMMCGMPGAYLRLIMFLRLMTRLRKLKLCS